MNLNEKPVMIIGIILLIVLMIAPVTATVYYPELNANQTGYTVHIPSCSEGNTNCVLPSSDGDINNATCAHSTDARGCTFFGDGRSCGGLFETNAWDPAKEIQKYFSLDFSVPWNQTHMGADADNLTFLRAACYDRNTGALVSYINYAWTGNSSVYRLIPLNTTEWQAPPVCSYTATPTSGLSPLSVSFNDTSTTNVFYRLFRIYDNTTSSLIASSESNDWTASLTGPAGRKFDVDLYALNSSAYPFNYCQIRDYGKLQILNTTVITYLDVKDISTGNYISGAAGGIYNGTANSWYNTTSGTGSFYFIGTGTTQQYPLGIGENVMFGASASGYISSTGEGSGYYSTQILNNYQVVTIYLVPTTMAPAAGTWNLYVHVKKDKTGANFPGVLVSIGSSNKTTDGAGNAQFYNLTPASIYVTASDPWYQTQTKYITGLADTVQVINFSMVLLGETPVPTTAIPTITATGTYTVTPTITGTSGGGGTGPVTCTGFWSPWCSMYTSMGASTGELPILFVAMLTLAGLIIGAVATGFTPAGAMGGAAVGFLISIAAGWISIIYIIAIILILVFVWMFFIK